MSAPMLSRGAQSPRCHPLGWWGRAVTQAAPPSTGPDTPLGIFAPFQSVLVTLPVGGTPRPAAGPLFCITELTARGDLQTPRQGLGSTAAGARGPLAGESRGLRGIPGQGGLSHLDIFIF